MSEQFVVVRLAVRQPFVIARVRIGAKALLADLAGEARLVIRLQTAFDLLYGVLLVQTGHLGAPPNALLGGALVLGFACLPVHLDLPPDATDPPCTNKVGAVGVGRAPGAAFTPVVEMPVSISTPAPPP